MTAKPLPIRLNTGMGDDWKSNLWCQMQNSHQQIVPGITVTTSGQATVDPSLADVLFDLALALEGPTNLPVDVEHVLAAIVLAARNGQLAAETPLSSDDPALADILAKHVKTVFEQFGGNVSTDD